MARYSDSFIEEVRERADVLEVVGRHVQLKKKGANWQGLCPFHHEKTPSFGVRPEQGFYKCFGCGAGGDVFKFLMEIKGVSFYEAIEEIANGIGLPLPVTRHENQHHRQQREERQQLLDIVDKARSWFRQQLHAPVGSSARHYLQQRGLKPNTIEQFGLGYAPSGWQNLLNYFGAGKNIESLLEKCGLVVVKEKGHSGYDRFRDRIIFPIQNYQGRCIAFGGRALAQGEPKYINSPETALYRKGEVLYGLNQAQQAIQQQKQVLVVEGYMDLIALANHGIGAVVATLGTALTVTHVRHLWKRTRRVCFCFDGDVAGKNAAWKALEQVLDGLDADRHASFLFLPDGEDPDDVVQREGASGFQERMQNATSLTQFLLYQLRQGLNTESPEGRAAMVHRVRPLLAKVADPLLRELFAESMGQYLGITGEQVMGKSAPVPHYAGSEVLQNSDSYHSGSYFGGSERSHHRRATHTEVRRQDHKVAGRDFEQILLAILLHAPDLMMTYEEELGRLELENPQLSKLLSVLINMESDALPTLPTNQEPSEREHNELAQRPLYDRQRDDGSPWWRKLPTTEMVSWAEKILLAEELEAKTLREEFFGCLLNCQLRHLQRQIARISREIDSGSGDDARQLRMILALKQEQKVLRQRKCHPAFSNTVTNQPA